MDWEVMVVPSALSFSVRQEYDGTPCTQRFLVHHRVETHPTSSLQVLLTVLVNELELPDF